jgi:hypothetical protein
MAPSMVQVAVRPSMRSAATNVSVFQCPYGTHPTRRFPRGVSVVPDHLRRDRRLINKDKAPRIEKRLLSFELGACGGDVRTILLGGAQSFFEVNLVAIVESPDRAYSYFHLLLGVQPHSDLVERQIRLLGNELASGCDRCQASPRCCRSSSSQSKRRY